MAFPALQLTANGMALMAQALTGQNINFSSVRMGDGTQTEEVEDMTALVSQVASLEVTSLTRQEATVSIQAHFTNAEVQTGFYWKELGVFCTSGGTEILYAYANAGDEAEYISAAASEIIEKLITVAVISANATNVTAELSADGYVTPEQLDAAIAAIDLSGYQKKTNTLNSGAALADADVFPYFAPAADAHRKTTWANIKAKLAAYFNTIYANAAELETTLQGYVPTARKVNAKALTGDITLSASDIKDSRNATLEAVASRTISTKFNATLSAASWIDGTYTLSNAAIKATSPVEILPRENNGISASQMNALVDALIVGGTQATGSIQLVAKGDVPTIDIPVTIIVRGDL